MRILVPTAAVMSLLWLGCAGPAQAHAHLKTATPAADSTVAASPAELRLTFTEDLELKFSGVAMKGPGKAVVRTGAPSLAPGDRATLIVPVPAALGPGSYTVEWHVTATDTHRTKGGYGFTVAP